MSYHVFAAYYDQLMKEVDYRQRAQYFNEIIRQHIEVTDKTILLDLACGTGNLSTELCGLGYDVIGVDASPDMLSEAMSKNMGIKRILYLCQDSAELDLYGTIDVTVCALDSLNHITDPEKLKNTFEKVSLFTAPGGLFLFDVNTEYKHREVLGNQTFVYDLDDLFCVWQNSTDENLLTEISLDFFVQQGNNTYERQSERFFERAWTQKHLCDLLELTEFELLAIYEGDTFQPVHEKSQRAVIVARKK